MTDVYKDERGYYRYEGDDQHYYTEVEVRKLQNAFLEYMNLLEELTGEYDILNDSEYDSLDLYGDEITLQWTEYDSCRGSEYKQKTFKINNLWGENWHVGTPSCKAS
jgi:hypothetical protein